MIWPLPGINPAPPDAVGRFGAVRKYDIHTGIDLYCPLNTPVVAIEAGVVVNVEPFTGDKAGSPWWHPTEAVLVLGASGIIVYGEIDPIVRVGDKLSAGMEIGKVVRVLKHDKGLPTTMLHLEWMTPHGIEDPPTTLWWPLGTSQPHQLLDPLPLVFRHAHL